MAKPETIDEYLAELSEDKRATLEKLRQTIRSVAPTAEEYFYYHIPAFRLNGQRLIGFAVATKSLRHLSIKRRDRESLQGRIEELRYQSGNNSFSVQQTAASGAGKKTGQGANRRK